MKIVSKTKYLLITLLTLLFCLPLKDINAQHEGRFIGGWAGGQYVRINNTGDYLARNINPKSTYNWAAGIKYLSQEGSFGFRSEIVFSQQGQDYTGRYEDINDVEHEFSSGVTLSYLKVPAMLNFRSLFNEAETVNLNIYAGPQVSILLNASMDVDPPVDNPVSDPPDLHDLFRTVEFAFASGANINYWPSENYALILGVRMDRGFTNPENLSYQFSDSDPTEYYFPVSTKKSSRPAQEDMENRRTSNNMTITMHFGIIFRISEH